MEALLTANKDKLYSFAFTDEEREIPPEQGDEDSGETFHETIRIYTISYNGEAYFADQVFHLSDDQKLLASQYAQNLTVLLGDGIYQGLSETEFSAMGLSYDGVIFADGETQVVYYNQLDERWKYSPYGTDTIGGYACGPTAMAIVISSLTSETIDPPHMAQWAYEHGYWCSGNGSYRSLIPGAAQAWSLSVDGCTASEPQRSPASKQCINVCEIRKQDLSANQLIDGVISENSILAKKIQQLHIFFSLLIPDISHEERQLLDEALIRTYAKKGITHNNESLIDPEHPDRYREMPLLGDIYEILMESPETRRMGNILNRLVNGSAKTFNQHTNVQLDNLYTVLDISELTGELLPVGMFVALDYVWDKAKEDRTKEKAIFIDEAWELIGDDDTNNPNNTKALAGEWVQEIFKIIRGYGGAAIAATQDIGDLDRSRFGKGILNVAKTKIILNLENDEAQRVQHILHLSDAEIMSITRFERGQGLISTNSNHITVSFKASPLEKQLITTDRMELNQILKEKIAQNTHNVVE